MSSAITPTAISNNLAVEGVSAQAPRGLDFVAVARTPTELANRDRRSRLDSAGAELELTPSSGHADARPSRAAPPCWSTGRSPAGPAGRRPAPGPGHGRPTASTSEWSEPLRIVAGFLAEGEWAATPIGLAAPSARGAARTGPDRVRGRPATSPARCCTRPRSGCTRPRQRQRRRRPGAEAGLDAVPVAPDPRDDRRDRCSSPGPNALGVRLAGGWATERYGFRDNAAPLLRRPAGGRGAAA